MNEMFLARGKLKYDNLPHKKGDWVYGNYVELKDGNRTMCCIYGYGEIIPETVGRYIGKLDKNGKRIFEGDIVEYNGTKHEVIFETRFSAYFGIKISHVETWQFCLEVPAKLMEVIGNIHDNPELLNDRHKESSNDQ